MGKVKRSKQETRFYGSTPGLGETGDICSDDHCPRT